MAHIENALAVIPPSGVDTYRASTDAATLCRDIVRQTASTIQGKKYVAATGWQAIAVAHGCTASAVNVERVDGGFRATGQVRRMDTGAVIAEAEGFVGEDEPVWFGGKDQRGKVYQKRPDFAIRAMAQTRAISRACRSAFAHVVVMIDKELGTTPAEEVQGVYDHDPGLHVIGGNVPTVDAGDAHLIRKDAVDPETGEVRSQYQVDKAKKAKEFADNITGTIKLSGQTVESLDAVWDAKDRELKRLAQNYPDLYEAVEKAYNTARDAAAQMAA